MENTENVLSSMDDMDWNDIMKDIDFEHLLNSSELNIYFPSNDVPAKPTETADKCVQTNFETVIDLTKSFSEDNNNNNRNATNESEIIVIEDGKENEASSMNSSLSKIEVIESEDETKDGEYDLNTSSSSNSSMHTADLRWIKNFPHKRNKQKIKQTLFGQSRNV